MKELKPGMLCWEVDEGRQVTTVKRVPSGHCAFDPDGKTIILRGWQWWEIDGLVTFGDGVKRPFTEDKYLIPLEGDQDQFKLETTNDRELVT